MNWGQFEDPISHMSLAGAVVSNTRGGIFEPFYCNEQYV